jgi:hypothetical protein
MAHSRAHSYEARASGRKKFDLNLRTYRQICDRKEAHTDLANIDPKGFNATRFGEYMDRGVEQLTFSSAPVLPEIASEKHWQKHEDKVAHAGIRTEITKGSVLPHRWDTSSCEYHGDFSLPTWLSNSGCLATRHGPPDSDLVRRQGIPAGLQVSTKRDRLVSEIWRYAQHALNLLRLLIA